MKPTAGQSSATPVVTCGGSTRTRPYANRSPSDPRNGGVLSRSPATCDAYPPRTGRCGCATKASIGLSTTRSVAHLNPVGVKIAKNGVGMSNRSRPVTIIQVMLARHSVDRPGGCRGPCPSVPPPLPRLRIPATPAVQVSRGYFDETSACRGSRSNLHCPHRCTRSNSLVTSSETMISGIDNVACTPLACAAATNSGPCCWVAAIATRTGRPLRVGLQTGAATGAEAVTITEARSVAEPDDRVWRLRAGVSPRPCLHCG
jgi:hypothetical protein